MNIIPDMTVLYVKEVAKSAEFYTALFGREPVQQTPGFALFVFDGGVKLGLWGVEFAQPASKTTGGGCELVVNLESRKAVDEALAQWRSAGVKSTQDAVEAEFGYTALAQDADGHRIRVLYTPME